MNSIEAMKQALEALDKIHFTETYFGHEDGVFDLIGNAHFVYVEEAITSLRQAIAEAEKQRSELLLDGKTVQEACLLELYEFQQATGCNSAAEFEAEKQEPVAWANQHELQNFDMKVRTSGSPLHTVPLYTHPQPKAEQCIHRLVDVTNPVVKSGYVCIECGALFRAAFESQPKAEQEPVIDKTAAIRIATVLGWEPKREWVGLTDEEIETFAGKAPNSIFAMVTRHDYARAIEAKLKEKNT